MHSQYLRRGPARPKAVRLPPLRASRIGTALARTLLTWTILIGATLVWTAAPVRAQDLVINTSYSPPLSTERQDGYFDLLIKEAFSRLGLDVRILQLPAERALSDANAGLADGDVGRVTAIADIYPDLVMVPEPVLDERAFVAFSTQGPCATPDWDSLAGHHIGLVRGWKIFEAHMPQAESAILAESTEQLFRLLRKGRVDLALSARLDGLAMARRQAIDPIYVCEPPLAVKTMYLYLHHSLAGLVHPLAEALRAMRRDGTTQAIHRQVTRTYLSLDSPVDP